ncbi:MAG TPA: hypothetical protein VFM18_16960 [Methanosarcina sp.]|nr:hypothetical protein [Methanosarcina sp.]
MKTFKHSGTLGDLIYSLYLVKKLGGGEFQIALQNIENCVAKYGYRPEDVDVQHKGRFTEQDIAWLTPLLERQEYIQKVSTWRQGDAEPDVDLDHYRSVLYRTFEGNILQAYHLAFGVPFTQDDMKMPWLEADPKTVKPIVITRSLRYRPPNGNQGWRDIIDTGMLQNNSIFVGTPKEHAEFTSMFGIDIEYYQAADFLDLANVIAGADLVVSNQGFTYSLATGLGKPTVLEINKLVPQHMNECYFPRDTSQYF